MGVQQPNREGFTLIELLVVIAIIGVLVALVGSSIEAAGAKAKIETARAELGQIESAINDYRTDLGFFPPDNPNGPLINPLYFELLGTTNDGTTYVTLDGSGQISDANGAMTSTFGRQGFANSGRQAHSSDEHGAPTSFLSHLRRNQIGEAATINPGIKILACSVEWSGRPALIPGTTLNPWRYISSHPTNNPSSYDLWVDLVLGNKTYQVNNWNQHP